MRIPMIWKSKFTDLVKKTQSLRENGCRKKCLDKSLQKCSGGKNSNVRFTGMTAENAIGEKLPIFVIGKSKTPRCFKHIQNIPCKYKSQKKSWKDSQIFEEWVHKFDWTFRMEGRKIAHPSVSNLTNVQLVFLPPNTTSVLQPMDQDVIRSQSKSALSGESRTSAMQSIR